MLILYNFKTLPTPIFVTIKTMYYNNMKSNYLLAILTLLIVSCNAKQKSKASTENSISFSTINVSKEKSSPEDYINTFKLNKDQFLNIHFTLEKPLVKSLQELAPNLTEDELLELGNFQFTFLVDGKKAYTENLNKGAGLKASKTSQREHTIRLVAPQKLDYWGWFMWLKFMKLGGGQDLLASGKHSLTIEVRPYIKQTSLKTGKILAKGAIPIEVIEKQIDKNLMAIQKIKPNSGWKLSEESFNHTKIEALNRKIAEGRFENINGIVVIKNNKLLIEEYFNGATRNSLHDARSVGKSFASTMLGIAIEDQFIKNENMTLQDFYNLKSYENYSSKKENVTLKSLLTMTAPFEGDDNNYNSIGNEENMYPTKNWVKFALDLPMQEHRTNDSKFTYFTAGVVVLGDIIHKSVPKGLVSYADKKLFAPLGITNYQWEYTPQKVGNTAGGIRLRALDFAKYGQLYKNKGTWNGKQILSEQWVARSLDKHIPQSLDKGHYGYLFWNKTFKINNQEYEVSYCSGMGGNKIFIFKNTPLVVVIISSAYHNPIAHQNSDKIMTDYILPAVL